MANYDDLLNSAPAKEQSEQLSKEEYSSKKKEERESTFTLSDQIALEVSGDSGRFRQYLDLQAVLDRYSAVNTLLIMAQKPESTKLGSFDYWKGKNCSVKPGQTAISILEPHEYAKEDGSPATGYNVKKVFDISQVDTRKLKAAPAPVYTERQLLQALISKAPVKIQGADELLGDLCAMIVPETGDILVRKGMEFNDSFRSLAQVLAATELTAIPNKKVEPAFSSYCAAYLLCKKYGVDTWHFSFEDAPGVFKGMEVQTVKGELSLIRDVAENISGRMARQLEQVKEPKSQDAR